MSDGGEDIVEEEAYVFYPPKEGIPVEDVPNLHLAYLASGLWQKIDPPRHPFKLMVAFDVAKESIKGECSRARIVSALKDLHDFEVYPPISVIEWIVEGLRDWANHNGDKALEDCLGLREPRKQRSSNVLDACSRELVRREMVMDVWRLKIAFGIATRTACEITVSRYEWMKEQEDPELLDLGSRKTVKLPSVTSLETYFKRDKEARGFWDEFSLHDGSMIRPGKVFDTEQGKRDLLSRFPLHAWGHVPELRPYRRSGD